MESFIPRIVVGLLVLACAHVAMSHYHSEDNKPEHLPEPSHFSWMQYAADPLIDGPIDELLMNGVTNNVILQTKQHLKQDFLYCNGRGSAITDKETRARIKRSCMAKKIACHAYHCRQDQDSNKRIIILRAAYVLCFYREFCKGLNITDCIVSHSVDDPGTDVFDYDDPLALNTNYGGWSTFLHLLVVGRLNLSDKENENIDFDYIKGLQPPCRTHNDCDHGHDRPCHEDDNDNSDFNKLPQHCEYFSAYRKADIAKLQGSCSEDELK